MPPTTRPSDKGHDNAEWWKDQPPESMEGEIPEGPAENNAGKAGYKKFDQEQHPVRRPT